MAKPNPFLALFAAAMALPAFAALQPVETIVGIKATSYKDCGSSASSQIEVETYQTPKQILSLVHILFQITAQNLIQSRTLVCKQFAGRFV